MKVAGTLFVAGMSMLLGMQMGQRGESWLASGLVVTTFLASAILHLHKWYGQKKLRHG